MATEIRSARPGDVDHICAVLTEALEPEDAAEARLVLEDPEFDLDDWLVGVVDGQVVSTMALFDCELRIGEAVMPAGQIEFVATSDGARGQGLVRDQMEELHRRSAAAGHLATFIVGIPNFYRQFGYVYAVRHPPYHHLDASVELEHVAGWDLRSATHDDVDAIVAAQRTAQQDATVAVSHTPQVWRWLIDSPAYDVAIAEHRGLVAIGRIYEDGDTAYLGDVVAPTRGALHALVARARTMAEDVAVMHRPNSLLTTMLGSMGQPIDELGWYYVRVADPAALVAAMRPTLEARLAHSVFTGYTGRLTLSVYRSSLWFDFVDGAAGEVVTGDPMPYPVSEGASGIPADRFADLLLGPHGALGLEHLHGDVLLGDQRELMMALFPPVTADIESWVFP